MTARYAALYASEAEQLLAVAGRAALALERDGGAEHVDALFRAVHTLKGMAGAMGYRAVEAAAHALEDSLARVRAGTLAATPAFVDAALAALDALESESARASSAASSGALSKDAIRDESREFVARFSVAAGTTFPGARAFLAVQHVAALGTLVAADPPAEALALGDLFGDVVVRVRTARPADDVERAIRRAGEIARVEVLPRAGAGEGGHAATSRGPEPLGGAAEVGGVGLGTAGGPPRNHDTPPSAAPPNHSDAEATNPTRPRPEPSEGPTPARRRERPRGAVRVDPLRLDALVDLAGELSIARSRLVELAARRGDAELTALAGDVARLATRLRDESLAARMAPVGDALERLPRVVRDAARALGKRATLRVSGADVALDRTVLDEIAEPIIHLVRNAVAHGIESPAERVAAGKPAEGTVTVAAARDRDAVVITVADDGRGVDRTAVLKSARARGLVDARRSDDTGLTDDELLRCIAAPGLSTAGGVTQVAGRGVGVDAVMAQTRAVGGTVALRTRDGAGTRFTLKLPVTLAVTRALVVHDAGERYVLPLTHVRETADYARDRVRVTPGRETFVLRDESLPLARLGTALGALRPPATEGSEVAPSELVILEAGGRAAAVAVDGFAGQHEVVVKPLPAVRGALRIFGGATILEDGSPALILDAPALLQHILP